MFLENFFAADFDGVGWHSTEREFGGPVGFTWCLRSQTACRTRSSSLRGEKGRTIR